MRGGEGGGDGGGGEGGEGGEGGGGEGGKGGGEGGGEGGEGGDGHSELCNFGACAEKLRWMQHYCAKTIGGKIDVRKRRRTTNSSLPAK